MKQMTPRTDAARTECYCGFDQGGVCDAASRKDEWGDWVAYEVAEQLETELNETKAALEREQLRLAACDVIAMADTPESAAKVRTDLPQDFQSAASAVIRRVDECIALRQMVRELRDALSECREDSVELLGEWAWKRGTIPRNDRAIEELEDRISIADSILNNK